MFYNFPKFSNPYMNGMRDMIGEGFRERDGKFTYVIHAVHVNIFHNEMIFPARKLDFA